MAQPWLKDGRKVAVNGVPVMCDECPCGETCQPQVDALVSEWVAQGWQVMSSRTANYSCAVWQNGAMVTPATGELIVALPHGSAPDFVSPAIMLVYGASLYNSTLDRWRAVGCRCTSGASGCRWQVWQAEDYDLAGTVPVLASVAQATPADGCRGDGCEILKRRITSCTVYDAALNGTLFNGEGWLGWVDPISLNYSYKVFQLAYRWTQNGATYVAWLDCDCSAIAVQTLGQSDGIYLMPNACDWYDQGCPWKFALAAMAQAEGWTLKGEGILLHKAACGQAVGDWFGMSWTAGLVASVAPTRIYYVPCNCNGISYQDTSQHPAGYWDWLEYDGACSCVDSRELVLDYPARFGVVDISWGNNTKYQANGGTYLAGHKSSSDMFLEYRTMCFILKEFDDNCNIRNALYAYSPAGSPEAQYNGKIATADSISFAGHAMPFEYDADLDWLWMGGVRLWHTDAPLGMACGITCYNDEQTARQQAEGEAHWNSVCALGQVSAVERPVLSLQAPDATERLVCASTLYQEGNLWCAHGTHYALGTVVTMPNGTPYAVVYFENWAQSNRGIIRPGQAPVQSLVVYGINGSHGNAAWYNCQGALPTTDQTITATLIDDDMHGCPGHDVDWQTSESE